MPPLPPDTRAAGQPGHIADHDALVDYMAALQAEVVVLQAQIAGGLILGSVQSGNYTLAPSDLGTTVEINSASAATVTIPPSSQTPFPVGAVIFVAATGVGVVTLVAGGGVTMVSSGGHVNISAQYAEAKLRQRSLNSWMLTGSLA
jgi:hypothetical protein